MVKGDRTPCCGVPVTAGQAKGPNRGHHITLADHADDCKYVVKIRRKQQHRGAFFPLSEVQQHGKQT